MPDKTAPAEVEAADAVTTPALTTDGVTPPNAVATAETQKPKKMTAQEALDGLNRMEFKKESEWVLDEPETDILAELERPDDPLAGVYEDDPAPEEQSVEQAAEQEPVKAEAEATPEEQAKEAAAKEERVRLNSTRRDKEGNFVYPPRERAIMNLSEEKGISLLAAEIELFGERQPSSEKPAEAVPAKKEPTAADIDAQIVDLKAKRKEAKANFNDDAKDDLTEKIEELLQSRQDALHRDAQAEQAQRETQGTFDQQVSASYERAKAVYPEAVNEGSPFNTAAQAYTDQLFATNSPLLQQADWPEVALAIVAAREGVAAIIPAKAAPKAVAVAKPPPKAATPPLKRATPAPSPGAVSSAPAPVSKHADFRQRMQAAKASGNLLALQKLGEELAQLSAA